jgi:hypothetical protein
MQFNHPTLYGFIRAQEDARASGLSSSWSTQAKKKKAEKD